MRISRLFAVLLMSGLFAASCELQEPVRPDVKYSQFYVETEQPTQSEPGTKTFADENGMVLWVNGDLVSVFEKKSYATKYRYDGGTGTTGGMLTKIPDSGSVTGTDVSHYYAVYPYETFNGLDNSENLILKIRNEQTWDYCSFGSGDNLMVAVSDDNKFQFKNVGGYIVLRLYGEGGVSSITLQGNNNEILAGDVKVTASIGGEPTVAMQKGSRYTTYKSVTLQCDDPVELTGSTKDTPVEFWFVTPATTFTQGLSFVVTDPDGNTFEKSTSNEIVVQRSHSKPLKTQVDFTASMKVAFADANFKAYCVENFDTDGDGEISYAEAKVVTNININTENIASLKGIEHFENLQNLTCRPEYNSYTPGHSWHLYNSNGGEIIGLLTTLDLSKNTKLKTLKCDGNQLSNLEVSHNTALMGLHCEYNQLTSLDVSHNTALTNLSCEANQLTDLDVSQNTALTDLNCGYNQLTSLDVSQNGALEYLSCFSNQLTTLNVSQNLALTRLACGFNPLTSLDVSHNTALTSLNCSYNQLTSLDVSHNTALTSLNCSYNQLTSLDVSHNTALKYLDCYWNQLASLDVSNNATLIRLVCYANQLTSLDVSNIQKFKELDCAPMNDKSGNNLLQFLYIANGQNIPNITENRSADYIPSETEIVTNVIQFADANFKAYCVENFDTDGDGEISYVEALAVTSISCEYKGIQSLSGIEYFANLTYLSCSSNQLTSLDVSQNTALENLYCSDNQLTSLDVSGATALTYLRCGYNQLTNLDVSHNVELRVLECHHTPLTRLEVSGATALTHLICEANQLTSLDVSHNTELAALQCGGNQLTSLDVSGATALTTLNCGSNQLTSLDVSQNTALQSLYCDDNQLTSLDVSNNSALSSLSCQDNMPYITIFVSEGQIFSSFLYDDSASFVEKGAPVPVGNIVFGDSSFKAYCVNEFDKDGDGEVSYAEALIVTGISCPNINIQSLSGIEFFRNLTSLNCSSNQLSNIDVSQNTALTSLWCSYNQLTDLDVSHNTALTHMNCSSNHLTSLDVSQNTALHGLYCQSNPTLTEIWMKTGQIISDFSYDTDVAILKYKD